MSTVTVDALEAGLRTHLLGSAPLVALLSSAVAVYRQELPPAGDLPAVLFSRQDGHPLWDLTGEWGRESEYVIRGVTAGHGSSALTAGSIADALDARLTDARFAVTGGSVIYCRRMADVDYPEQAPGGTRYNHRGGLFRLWTT